MQFPEFKHKDATVDQYKVAINRHITRHYGHTAHLITTVQGEAFWLGSKVEPEDRKDYGEFNIRVVSTTDNDCPLFLEPDGTPVKKAWLQHKGQQILLIDYDSGIAVRLDYERGQELPEFVPHWIKAASACAWWPGAGVRPYGKPIKIGQPYKACAEEEELVKSRKAQCEMWYNLTIETEEKRQFFKATAVPFITVAQTPFEKMDQLMRMQLAKVGVERDIVPRLVDHLVLKTS